MSSQFEAAEQGHRDPELAREHLAEDERREHRDGDDVQAQDRGDVAEVADESWHVGTTLGSEPWASYARWQRSTSATGGGPCSARSLVDSSARRRAAPRPGFVVNRSPPALTSSVQALESRRSRTTNR